MKGAKELLLSFAFGSVSLFAYAALKRSNQVQERSQPVAPPIASAGPSEDPNLALAWGLQEIHAPEVWKKHQGSKDIVVAVIDTGCDIHHPGLQKNIWRNRGEGGLDKNGDPKSSNGIDDDDNGFVDDFHGWNFSDNTNDVSDEHGHGTHIAGIIGAEALDGVSARGIAPHVSLMILKYFAADASGPDNLRHTISAIRYAVKMGANIINYSGGGILRSQEEEEALRWAASQGVLVVAAAGNEGSNSDFLHFYPADYDLPNLLSVAAIDSREQLLRLSNYGRQTVHLAAPGKNIYSTLPGGGYGYMTGTSQATAFATGVAALLMADDAQMRDPATIIHHLLTHTSTRSYLRGKLRSGGILDAEMALDSDELKLSEMGN